MGHEDELERMRRRGQRRRDTQIREREHQRRSGGSREQELNVIEFDDLEPVRQGNPRPRRRPPARDYGDDRYYSSSNRKKRRPRRQKTAPDQDYYDPREHQRDRKKRQKRGFPLFRLILLLMIGVGVYFGYRYFQGGSGYWTVAVFGVDSRNGSLEKGALSDVEMLCVIDRKTGEIKLVSVYRDTYLEISPDGTYHKINEAYFKGGHQQAIEALERNLDLAIDDYATFNWKAVADAITILGGIDLEISDSEFRYINAFITETVESTGLGSHHLEHAGMNHLDGVQAVAYARLRLMDTDYNRTARQRLVIQLAMNKAKEADFKTLSIVAQTVIPQLSTSISLDDVISMARNIKKYHIGETGGFPFSRGEALIGKKDCVVPLTLESNVVQLHQFLYGTENHQPSATVRQISDRIASDSGMGEVAENAPEARVSGQKALEGGGNPVPTTGVSPAPENNGKVESQETEHGSGETSPEETAAEDTSGDGDTAVTESPESETDEADSFESEENGKESESPSESTEPTTALESSAREEAEKPGGPGENLPGEMSSGPVGPGNSDNQGQGDNVLNEKPVVETMEVGPGV